MPRIREAQERKELEPLTELFLEYINFEFDQPTNQRRIVDPETHSQEYRSFFTQLLRKKPHKIFVLEEDNQLIGFVYTTITKQPPVFANTQRGHIQGIYVKPKYRKRGYGTELVSTAMTWLEENGVQEIECMITQGNTSSLELFRKNGFSEIQIKVSNLRI